ncbi:phage tail tape measure protein [Paenibacillus thermotolerans]|uniref:phage tail tape measure protein n=1 Tax=Paenibacillus thermotolerans TaxID=3027807 RepID=UPI002367503E|nr:MULTISPECIES: phage tail tape measure protein [unclassified Paenibacillus]
MADEQNKDLVAARINLDTTKIGAAFKVINDGLKSNLEAFQKLNAEIGKTEKSYASLAQVADKMALTADERKKKILAESDALVAQRTAQAELYRAKVQQLNATNQLVDAKLQSQLALQKRRQAAIEQQEREHLVRMDTLRKRDELAALRLDKVNSASPAQEGLRYTSQYLLAGTLYYNAIRGAKEAITVLKDFESNLVNIQRVMGDTANIELIKKSMISDAKEYGYALSEVGKVYTLIGQQGFDEKQTAALARTAMMASNVEESFNGAAQAQELLTGAVLNYNMAAEDSERLLDMLNEVSNNFATDSNKLLQGINRTGAAAKNAGVPIERLIGYLTVLNQAGFTGSVAGNAIKSFISFSSRDIAIDKLEKYVGTIKQANGEMMPFATLMDKIAEKWKVLTDVQRHEITQAVARGDQASRFIALMDNYSKTIDVATTAENSFGSAQRENALAMSTLEKQSMQLKASWDELIVSMGESGFLAVLKAIVHEQKVLVDGFNSLPEPIRNTLTVTLSLGAAIAVLNTGMKLLTGQSLVQIATGLAAATRNMFGLKVATDAANISQRAFIATPIGATLTVIAAVLGAATLAWSHYKGAVNEVDATTRQNNRDTVELADKYKELKRIVDDNTKSDKEIKQAKQELSVVIERISSLMPNLVSQWDAHGKAIDINIEKLDEFQTKYKSAMMASEQANLKSSQDRKNQLENEISDLTKKLDEKPSYMDLRKTLPATFKSRTYEEALEEYRGIIGNQILAKGEELRRIQAEIQASANAIVSLEGTSFPSYYQYGLPKTGGSPVLPKTDEEIEEEYRTRREDFQSRMAEFRHLVNVESTGYKTAQEQLAKLQAIRKEFNDLEASDLYGIDEDIYRLKTGKKIDAKGLGGTKLPPAFSLPLNDIDGQKIQAELIVNDVQALIDMFSAKEFSLAGSVDVVAQKVGLYTQHQQKLHEANNILRASVEALNQKQGALNELYKAGKITTDEYNKATEDVQGRVKSFTEEINRNSIAWWNDAKAKKAAKDQELQDSFDASSKWIAHMKATGQLSAQQELEAWQRVQSRYLKGTELRRRADEQVYTAKKALISEEERMLEQFVSKQRKQLDEAKRTELQSIQDRRDEYVNAQDEKIRAIERLMAAEQDSYEDADYEKDLAAKQARLKVLESAVGPEGKKERTELLKEIAKMEEDRRRELRKRDLESQKQTLEDQKREQIDEFEKETKRVEQHYEDLLKPFENFVNDMEGRAETLKQIQILKESEKNAEILKNLDVFISQYQAKMSKIATLEGDVSVSSPAPAGRNIPRGRNEVGDQQFADGGIVKGRFGEAVPVVAHAGEMFLNESQQNNLFKLLSVAVPRLNIAMPSFDVPAKSVQHYNINNHFDLSAGEVNLHDQADIRGFYDERATLVKRMQAKGGQKIR